MPVAALCGEIERSNLAENSSTRRLRAAQPVISSKPPLKHSKRDPARLVTREQYTHCIFCTFKPYARLLCVASASKANVMSELAEGTQARLPVPSPTLHCQQKVVWSWTRSLLPALIPSTHISLCYVMLFELVWRFCASDTYHKHHVLTFITAVCLFRINLQSCCTRWEASLAVPGRSLRQHQPT